MTEKKKSLFDKAIDALTDRDEKEAEAAEQAKALAAAARKEADARARLAAEKAAEEKNVVMNLGAKTIAERAAGQTALEKATAEQAAGAPTKGIVTVRSLRIRADHSTKSDVVAGLIKDDEVLILDTWSDGKNTWAKLEKGWAAMVYDGETYIKLA